MNAPPWLARALHNLPIAVCGGCGLVVLQSDADRNGAAKCRCAAPTERPGYLPEVAGPDDGGHVGWTPIEPKDRKVEADCQGGVVFYERSKVTKRWKPARRIPPWTEGT